MRNTEYKNTEDYCNILLMFTSASLLKRAIITCEHQFENRL